MKKITECGLRV